MDRDMEAQRIDPSCYSGDSTVMDAQAAKSAILFDIPIAYTIA